MLNQIKNYCLILYVVCLNFISLVCFSQNTAHPAIVFKIVNYKQYYNRTDDITLSVENTSNKPLYFTIGQEFLDNGRWSLEILDLLAPNPLDANIIRYKIIRPHKLKLITIYYKKRHYLLKNYPLLHKHGFSLPIRFVLRYHDIASVPSNTDNKIVSKVFKDIY
jgi:hypothetical protein